MIELIDLVKRYRVGHSKPDVEALRGISVQLPDTGMVFVLGKSGSGKSTFLNVVGGLDSFEGGDLILFGKSAREFTDKDYNAYRNKYVGFIFQEYNIINSFTVRRNIELALELQNKTPDWDEVDEILDRVGLLELADRYPSQLSGGQKQRIAIARALIKHPQVVLADEPTGALDSQTSQEIFTLLKEMSQERLVVCVTHDAACAEKYADRIIRVKEGLIVGDITRRSDDGIPVEGTQGISELSTGLIRIDDPQSLTSQDIEAIKNATSESTGPAYYAYGDHVRIPSELAEGDDSEDIPVGFTDTTQEDILAGCTKNRQFKYIRSTMRSKTMFALAESTMKHSPGRLAMTIILSLLSFTILGVATAIAAYNPASTFAESASIYRPAASVLQKTLSSDEESVADQEGVSFTDEDLDTIRDRYSTAIPYRRTTRGSLTKSMATSDYDGNDWFGPTLLGFAAMDLTESELEDDYGFTLVGDLPESGEVLLTDYAVWVFSRSGFTYTDPLTDEEVTITENITAETLIGKPVHLTTLSSVEDEFTISGILITDLTEEQVGTDLDLVSPAETNAYTLELDNYNNGPLRLAYLNGADMTDSTIVSNLGMRDYLQVLVPTPTSDSLATLWTFADNTYATTSGDFTGTAANLSQDTYTAKSYDIVSTVITTWLESSTFTSSLSAIQNVATFASIILAVIAVLITMNYLFTSVSFKSRDIGILKGLGSSSHEVFGIFVIEAMIIATINFACSLLVSWGLTTVVNSVLQNLFGIPLTIISMGWVTVLVLFLMSFGVSIISALIPSYWIANMKPVDAMKRSAA